MPDNPFIRAYDFVKSFCMMIQYNASNLRLYGLFLSDILMANVDFPKKLAHEMANIVSSAQDMTANTHLTYSETSFLWRSNNCRE